jgi:hypothetical protein
MRPVCTSFPAVLAPCLLGGRMLGPGRLVHFGPIGLDQPKKPLLRVVTNRDRRSLSAELPRDSGSMARGTRPVEQPQSARTRRGITRAWSCRARLDPSRAQSRSRRSSRASTKVRPGDPEVHARYICALTCGYPADRRVRRHGYWKPTRGRPHAGRGTGDAWARATPLACRHSAVPGPGRPQHDGGAPNFTGLGTRRAWCRRCGSAGPA